MDRSDLGIELFPLRGGTKKIPPRFPTRPELGNTVARAHRLSVADHYHAIGRTNHEHFQQPNAALNRHWFRYGNTAATLWLRDAKNFTDHTRHAAISRPDLAIFHRLESLSRNHDPRTQPLLRPHLARHRALRLLAPTTGEVDRERQLILRSSELNIHQRGNVFITMQHLYAMSPGASCNQDIGQRTIKALLPRNAS